ncbi:MAG: hypothetical protein DRQ02_06445 [Candidatus Latescibacterota bacterium]|nr:MAG: hypothetical protein DRQ02_06445 [Candidatus Latescibacterota bacterium]RKY71335.1 MAG: hypothetical protein DRQ24_07590 [Candidatus Latescibacterota bacterium]
MMPWESNIGKKTGSQHLRLARAIQKTARNNIGVPLRRILSDCSIPCSHGSLLWRVPQIEKSVGLTRMPVDEFSDALSSLPRRVSNPRRFILVTGVLASGFMEEITQQLNQMENLTAELVVVKNGFFGASVTVSGLLTGRDILRLLREKELAGGTVLLPPNCVKTDGVLLDDMGPLQIEEKLGLKVRVTSYDLVKTILSE